MNNLLTRLGNAFLVILVAGSMISCSDNPSGNDAGDPPSIPQIQQHQPKITYFQDNYPASSDESVTAEYSNFNSAAAIAISSAGILTLGQGMANGFMSLAQNNDADFEDDTWQWEYSYSYDGESLSVRLIAEAQDNDDMKWQMFLNSSGSDGENFENYKFMEGTVSSDGQSGNWHLFDFEPDQESNPAITFTWDATGDTDKTLTFTAYDNDSWSMKVDYMENGSEFEMSIETSDSESITQVFWNTDTGTGSMIEDGTETCWNTNFENIACS